MKKMKMHKKLKRKKQFDHILKSTMQNTSTSAIHKINSSKEPKDYKKTWVGRREDGLLGFTGTLSSMVEDFIM